MRKVSTQTLLSAVIVTGAGDSYEPNSVNRSFQLTGSTSAGAGAASVDIEVSNDGTNFIKIGTLSLILSTTLSQAGMLSNAPWRYVRGNVKAISGTDAAVTLTMGNVA